MNLITQYIKSMGNRLRTTSLVFILILIEVYFLVNGGAHFEEWGQAQQQTIIIYIVMVVAFMIFHGSQTRQEMNIPLHQSILNFVMFFIGTYFALSAISYLTGSTISPMSPEMFYPTVVMQVAVIATSEELMFRGVLLEKFGILVSSVLFAMWHTYAYGIQYYNLTSLNIGIIFPFFVAFFIGLILALLVKQKQFGLPTAIAIHACYNLFVSGAFITFGML